MADESDVKKMKGETIEYLLKFCISQLLVLQYNKNFSVVVLYTQATTELDILYLLTTLVQCVFICLYFLWIFV